MTLGSTPLSSQSGEELREKMTRPRPSFCNAARSASVSDRDVTGVTWIADFRQFSDPKRQFQIHCQRSEKCEKAIRMLEIAGEAMLLRETRSVLARTDAPWWRV